FERDRIYELTYPDKNPMVMGLAFVVTRDLASYIRYQARDDAGNPNPLALNPAEVEIRRAYGSGISSTGMYMRDYLYLGFNEDEAHRKVFDAVQITIPGTHRLLANVEFSDPNTYSRQDVWHDWLSYSYPPLTFAVTTDPISVIRDGILERPATDPLVFQVDSANEFWQMNASLNVHDAQSKAVPIPDNVRLYFASSFHHLGVAGIRPIEVRVPTATLTGWNVRADGRRPGDLCGLSGAYVPFAKTKAERQAANDPRPSVEERYGDQGGYLKAVEAAARALVNERFLLQEDADR